MRRFRRLFSRVAAVGALGAVVAGGVTYWKVRDLQRTTLSAAQASSDKPAVWRDGALPTREEQIKALQETLEFDMLVIGGGATGAGVALDAQSRGLKTALVEMYDFASGTSSRSTKLIHGGVRYLQKAILGFDVEQYKMVKEALSERANLLAIAPHLSYPLPIMLPVYQLWQIPYYWGGIKAYDFVAGSELLKPSYFLNKTKALELFPMLKRDQLCGALVYYDGQQNDARMNVALALTSARLGAAVANHVQVIQLIHNEENGTKRVSGAVCRDRMTGKEFTVRAKSVVNATGPFTDSVRRMDFEDARKIVQPSSGVHIILPDYYSPQNMGLLDPSTSDGRVIFFLPWLGHTMAGTTDSPCTVTHHPEPTEEEIQFILQEVRSYLSPDVRVRRGDVLSAWSGIRPLVLDPSKTDTQSLARNHLIIVSDSKLVTIAGGKWTTYRHMAEETVDEAMKVCGLKAAHACSTRGLMLEGGHNWTPLSFIRLVQDFGMDTEVARHLSSAYGDRAGKVVELGHRRGPRGESFHQRLHPSFPNIESEIIYAVQREYACTLEDVIARRMRIAFLNVEATVEALPRVVEIMGKELKWDKKRQEEELANAKNFLRREMGHELGRRTKESVDIKLSREELSDYNSKFRSMDYDNKGYITVSDLRRYFKSKDKNVAEDSLHDLFDEVDLAKNGRITFIEFLQLMSAIKSGDVVHSRFAQATEMDTRPTISVKRSGGGV